MAALRYVGVAAVLFAILFAYSANLGTPAWQAFEEVRPDLYRIQLECRSPIFSRMPVAAWLINLGQNSWILIDSGANTPKNRQALVAGLRDKLNRDFLKLIVGELVCAVTSNAFVSEHWRQFNCNLCFAVTHGHADHTGALQTLLDLYPSIQVAYHKQEQAYLSGGGSYADLKGDTAGFNLIKHLVNFNTTLVPKGRSIILAAESGDLSDILTSIPKDVVEFHTVPGHTPGQIAVLHKPTGSFIAADSLMHLPPLWPWSSLGQPVVHDPVAIGSFSMQLVRESQQRIAALPAVSRYFPSHDAGMGVSREQLNAFLSA